MRDKVKVLFVYPHYASFIEKDIELLARHFDLRIIKLGGSRWRAPLVLNLLRHILWADLTFSWFADNHSFLSILITMLFGKESIVTLGGYEVAKIPEMKYGLLLKRKNTLLVKYTLKNASTVLAVEKSLKKEAIENLGLGGGNIIVLPTGFDSEKFKPKGKKQDLVVAVSTGKDWMRVKLKGIETFVGAARLIPDVKFVVVGSLGEGIQKLQKIAPANVSFIDFLSQDELIPFLQKAKVHCQLSMREGFPNSICEAMLCECVPVGTDIPGNKTAMGDVGLIVPFGDEKATADAILEGLNSGDGKKARERIKERFSENRREAGLVEAINCFYPSKK